MFVQTIVTNVGDAIGHPFHSNGALANVEIVAQEMILRGLFLPMKFLGNWTPEFGRRGDGLVISETSTIICMLHSRYIHVSYVKTWITSIISFKQD